MDLWFPIFTIYLKAIHSFMRIWLKMYRTAHSPITSLIKNPHSGQKVKFKFAHTATD